MWPSSQGGSLRPGGGSLRLGMGPRNCLNPGVGPWDSGSVPQTAWELHGSLVDLRMIYADAFMDRDPTSDGCRFSQSVPTSPPPPHLCDNMKGNCNFLFYKNLNPCTAEMVVSICSFTWSWNSAIKIFPKLWLPVHLTQNICITFGLTLYKCYRIFLCFLVEHLHTIHFYNFSFILSSLKFVWDGIYIRA